MMVLTRYVLKSRIFLHSPATFFCARTLSSGVYSGVPSIKRLPCFSHTLSQRFLSTDIPPEAKPPATTPIEKLRTAVKDYGSTVIVFHVTISLISLGSFYVAVSSGLDVIGLVQKLGINMGDRMSSVVEGAGTFAIAYAVHKVFAPVRISITLGTTPFIVRYFRKIGLLKPPDLCRHRGHFPETSSK